MKRRWGSLLAVFGVLVQASQPLLAATRTAGSMYAPSAMVMHMRVPAASAALPCADHAADDVSQLPKSTPAHGHGCCCHGTWSCGGPCGAAALLAAPAALALSHAAPLWLRPRSARSGAPHPLELLRPPIAT